MSLGVHLGYGIGDYSVLVYHISGSDRSHALLAAHFFQPPSLISLEHSAVGITEKMKWELIFSYELPVRGLGVLAHTENLIAARKKTLVVVPKVTGLGRAAGSAILGIEVEDKFFALIVGKAYLPAILIRSRKIGSFGSNC